MKKILALITFVVMLFGLAVPSFAEEAQMTFTVEQVTAGEAETVDVPIVLSNNSGITGATIYIEYNEGLKLNSINAGNALKTLALSKTGDLTEKPIKLLWDGMDPDSSNGTVAILNFDRPTEGGVYEVIIYCLKNDIIGSDLNTVAVTTVNGYIKVEEELENKQGVAASGVGTGTFKWKLDEEGCLYLSGNGEATENSWTNPEWLSYSSQIKKVVISSTGMTRMRGWFYNCQQLKQAEFINCDTSNVTTMADMFECCSSLVTLDMRDVDTSSVRYMSSMFNGCKSLESLDLSMFDTSNVAFMSMLFKGCSSLKSLNISSFDTSSAKYMDEMFQECKSLESLDLSNFNTANVEEMNGMFELCCALKSVNLSSFDTANVRTMSNMFSVCSALESIDLSTFDLTKLDYFEDIFSGCSSLTVIKSPKVVMEYQFIDFPEGTRWYSGAIKNPSYMSEPNEIYYVYDEGIVTPEGFQIIGIDEDGYVYTGAQIKPEIQVYDKGKLLKLNTDYTLKYTNNLKAGTAEITITGKGNYCQVETIPFTILSKSIGDGANSADGIDITIADKQYNNGKELISKPVIKYGKIGLKENVDYLLFYSEDRCNIGTVTVTIRGIGNYADTTMVKYKIFEKGKNFTTVVVDIVKSKTYTGKRVTLCESEIHVYTDRYKTEELRYGVDYNVSYLNNINVGTASAIITGIGDYEVMGNSKKVTFKIDQQSIANASIQIDEALVYTGTAIKPTIKVVLNEKVISPEYYTVSYINNINAGYTYTNKAPTVKVVAKGNYKGTVTRKFTISPKKLSEDDVNITVPNMTYLRNKTESSYKVKPVIKYGTKTLANGKDFKVEFTYLFDGEDMQFAKVIFIGNYRGTAPAYFRLTGYGICSDFNDGTYKVTVADAKYTGRAVKPKVVVLDETSNKAVPATNYTVTYSDNIEVSNWAGVDIEAKGNKFVGSFYKNFRIYEKDINKAAVSVVDQNYSGNQINPVPSEVIVYYDGTKLSNGTDYEIEYSDSVKAGKNTGNLTIKGLGDYGNSKKVKFNILQKKIVK